MLSVGNVRYLIFMVVVACAPRVLGMQVDSRVQPSEHPDSLDLVIGKDHLAINFPKCALKNDFSRVVPGNPEKHTIDRGDGSSIVYEHYRTGKDTLIVFALGKGDGLRNQHRHKAYIIEFLKHYDVVVFDYAWKSPISVRKLASKPFITTFQDSHEDVQALVTEMRKKHGYKQIVGHGECYSAYMFAQAESLKDDDSVLFDKLVLDSPIISARQCAYEMCANPALFLWPLAANKHPWFTKCVGRYFAYATTALMQCCSSDHFTRSVLGDVANITIPVLVIRGEHDPMVSDDDFAAFWHALASKHKALLKTPFKHSDSFAYKNKARGRYCYVENAFIQKDFSKFAQQMRRLRIKA